VPFVVQKHGEEKNPRDELLLGDPKKISSQKSMNSQRSDYNVHKLTICGAISIAKVHCSSKGLGHGR
jgi:hypothetical protein